MSLAPRLLTPAQARKYLGGREPSDFAPPFSDRGELRYDRSLLDRRLDELSGLTRSSEVDEADQALADWLARHGSA